MFLDISYLWFVLCFFFFFFKQKTAYEMRISDWSSDVCSSDLEAVDLDVDEGGEEEYAGRHRLHGVRRRQARQYHLGDIDLLFHLGAPRCLAQLLHNNLAKVGVLPRSEERGVGKEWVSTGRSWWWTYS